MITIIMQTHGNSIQSSRKFRVQPLAGEPEKNVWRSRHEIKVLTESD